MGSDPTSYRLLPTEHDGHGDGRKLTLQLDTFAWETLAQQAQELGVTVDELAVFSVVYYLADLDSKRIARRIPTELRASPERE
jgi:hypothetical protein